MNNRIRYCALAACMAALSPVANAYEAGDWVVRGRVINVDTDRGSSTIRVGGNSVAGSGVSVNDDVVPELDITYMINKNWGLELILGTSSHDVDGEGTLAGLGGIIDAKVLPPTLTLQYHFLPNSHYRPYVGIGLNYTTFYDERVTGGLSAPGARVSIDSSTGLALQAGIDIDINDSWFINIDVKAIDIDTTANFTNTAVGPAAVDVDLDPVVFGIGIGTTF